MTTVAPEAPAHPAELYRATHNPVTREITVDTDMTLVDFRRVTPEEDWAKLIIWMFRMRGKFVAWINATALGGGVALMRKPQLALLQQLAWTFDQIQPDMLEEATEDTIVALVNNTIDALAESGAYERRRLELTEAPLGIEVLRPKFADFRWYVLAADLAAFLVTKQWHNVYQGLRDARMTQRQVDVYEAWMAEERVALAYPLRHAHVVVCDDWQPNGLLGDVSGELIFRDHIDSQGTLMATPGTPQYDTWAYMRERILRSSVFVAHPVPAFVPGDVPPESVVYMPATCDLLEHAPLPPAEIETRIAFVNYELHKNEGQAPIELVVDGNRVRAKRPFFTLVARFDPAKNHELVLAAYAKARQLMLARGMPEEQIPDLVVIGMASVDDPDGPPILARVMELRRTAYAEIRDHIKVVRTSSEASIIAVMQLALMGLQPSLREGFESRATEYTLNLVAAIVSIMGGLPLQIVEGETGFIRDPGLHNADEWAELMADYATNLELQARMLERMKVLRKTNSYRFTTIPNTLGWLALCWRVLNGPFQGNGRNIAELIDPAVLADPDALAPAQ